MITIKTSNIQQKIIDYSKSKTTASLFHLISTVHDLEDISKKPDILIDNSDINEICDFIKTTLLDLENIYDNKNEGVEETLKKVSEYKNKLKKYSKNMYAYSYAIDFTKEVLYVSSILYSGKDDEQNERLYKALLDVCLHYVGESEMYIPFPIEEKKAQVISCFPLTMTKQKYNDYVYSSLMYTINGILTEESARNLIDFHRYKYNPFYTENYGEFLPSIANKIKDFLDTDFPSLTTYEDYKKMWDIWEDIAKEIDDTTAYFEIVLKGLTYIYIILSFNINSNDLFGNNLAYKDIYFTFKENYGQKELDASHEQFLNDLEDCIVELSDKSIRIEKQILAQYGKHKDTDHMKSFFEMKRLVDFSLYDLCFEMRIDKNIIDPKVLSGLVNDFIEYVNSSIVDFDIKEQKFIKQVFLQKILCFMEEEEFSNYISCSFDTVRNKKYRMVIVDRIKHILQDNIMPPIDKLGIE